MYILGIVIGFYGYLLPGNINIMVMQLYTEKRMQFLIAVILLIVLMESVYCFATLSLIQLLPKETAVFQLIKISAVALSFLLGLWMLLEKKQKNNNAPHNITRGIFSIFVHPQQITFWVLTSVLFQSTFDSVTAQNQLPLFLLCNAIGTLAVILLYTFAGSSLLKMLDVNFRRVNQSTGLLYIILSIHSAIKIVNHIN